MSDRLIRSFLSVPVDEDIHALRDNLQKTVNTNGARISWIRKGNIHLTLKFIGDTPEDDVKRVSSTIKNIITSAPAMQFDITGTGCFPKKERPRTLWLGIKGDLNPLQVLVSNINDALNPLGYPKEEKKYVPHLTLARIKYPQKNTPDISAFLDAEYEPIQLHINKIHFMRSELFFKGSVYTILDTHFLT